jgi:hypothetical protein
VAVLETYDVWVGAERRADGDPRHPGFFPQGYVTVKPDDKERLRLTPAAAREVAKRLKAFADVLDPPAPRVRRKTA